MSNDGLLPSEEQLDEFLSSESSEEFIDEDVEETPETEEEKVTLSQEEYDELKKGQMLQADYTRKRQEESQTVKDLQEQLSNLQNDKDDESSVELDMDLDESGLPDSVKKRVGEIDKIKRELEIERERSRRAEVKRNADAIVSNLNSVEGEYPVLKNKAVKFAVMAYASQVLNNPTKEGFMDAAKQISTAFKDDNVKTQVKLKKKVANRRATSPSVGSGGSAPIRTVDAPKSFAEANDLVMDALAKINALDNR